MGRRPPGHRPENGQDRRRQRRNSAARALQNHLSALWGRATDPRAGGYDVASPFARAAGGRAAFEKPEEKPHRERRLQEGEEDNLLKAANPHLRDIIVAALEAGMRKGELLSLQWRNVRWLQNELFVEWWKAKTKRSRRIPISPALREVLTRRQDGMTTGPNPQSFKFGPDHYVFGDEAGNQIKSISTAWENAVLKAHGVKPVRDKNRRLSRSCLAQLAEIDLNFHDLRHEAGSRKVEADWPLHYVSAWLGHSKLETTAKYLNVTARYLHVLNERMPLTLVKG